MNFHFIVSRLALVVLLALFGTPSARAIQQDIAAPSGSGNYAMQVVVLPNGNIVVVDMEYTTGVFTHLGAVYLLNGATLAVISKLRGFTSEDYAGSGGVTVLSNGNFVVCSPNASGGAGAVTWGSATTGFGSGTVTMSGSNTFYSLTAGDQVGSQGIVVLPNGNYIVCTPHWHGTGESLGAVTWCNGSTGRVGIISAANSLVGTTTADDVGNGGVIVLSNGNYVVSSPNWDNGAAKDVGAVTWCDGSTGRVGAVSAANSLVGVSFGDSVGSSRIAALTDGNYVVASPFWDNTGVANAGAVTWCDGNTGRVGSVSTANSLVGPSPGDLVGSSGVTALTNGNYVLASPGWDNGAVPNVGAVTWVTGGSATVGVVSAASSLVGSTAEDQVSYSGITALTNGSYVVASPYWDGAASDVGAVTWCSGSTSTVGTVSAANSLVGSTVNDSVGSNTNLLSGSNVLPLANGNYVVASCMWDRGTLENAGAVTWGSGSGGTVGPVSAVNSLVGSTANDQVGYSSATTRTGITALTNGSYVVASPQWDNGSMADVGAATWGNGSGGTVGVISAANSLIGSATNDAVGGYGVVALFNGSYVVGSPNWDNAAVADAGAVTWASASGGTVGAVSPANSLVGSNASDQMGRSAYSNSINRSIIPLPNGDYLVQSSYWNNPSGSVADAGVLTYADGTTGGTLGSVLGTVTNGLGYVTALSFDPVRNRLLVGRGSSNFLSILPLSSQTNLQIWRTRYYGTATNSGSAADTATPLHDGVSNLIKFATGLDPATNTPQPGSMTKNDSILEFTYPRSTSALAECTFTVEWSDTLLAGSWNSTGVTESILSATSTLQQVKATIPGGAGSSRFVRLRVTTP